MKKLATLSGWGQPFDALDCIAPGATHINYAPLENFDRALELIGEQASHADVLIGWSLGGLLALHAVCKGYASPKKLVLLAAPFAFVESPVTPEGMDINTFQQFVLSYKKSPQKALRKMHQLIMHGDANAKAIEATLNLPEKQLEHGGYWLDALAQYNCQDLDVSSAPPTLIFHGKQDVVISPAQSARLKKLLPDARLTLLEKCGHAPHLNNTAQIKESFYD